MIIKHIKDGDMKQKMRFILKINVLNKYGHYLIIIMYQYVFTNFDKCTIQM